MSSVVVRKSFAGEVGSSAGIPQVSALGSSQLTVDLSLTILTRPHTNLWPSRSRIEVSNPSCRSEL